MGLDSEQIIIQNSFTWLNERLCSVDRAQNAFQCPSAPCPIPCTSVARAQALYTSCTQNMPKKSLQMHPP
ncbi:hypothetical protein J1614_005536 [Plenodomus biglobosus]|nr:hypothetical protein J1614_005536 [Plenodomus biglobosus]